MESGNMMLINGHEFTFLAGETILQVARRNGIEIPTLCYMKNASPTGACRICLVEVEGARTLIASCAMPAAPRMVVRTETPRVVRARRMNMEFLLSSGNHNCLVQDLDMDSWTDFQLGAMSAQGHEDICPAYGHCKLQELAIKDQIRTSRFAPKDPGHRIENVNPFIVRDLSRCILCGRCVQACNDVQVNNAISFGYRGKHSKIVARGDRALKDSDCVFCGECVQACPVGALVTTQDWEMRAPDKGETKLVRTTCSYCGVGCQMHLHVRKDRIVKVTGVEELGPNYGSLCVKGRFGYDFVHDSGRLTKPMIREKGILREASWDEALNLVAQKLKSIQSQHGADAIGVLSSARITNEENYLVQKFTRAVVGTNNVDHCARL
jgi:formate dehydrogenase major subunit/formate dehydrogenase alpha subunit